MDADAAGGATRDGPAGHRLPRAARLLRTREFRRVFEVGSRARGSLVTVAVAPNDGERTRLGLSIGRRVWKRAVRRNRVRRLVREAFRLACAELPPGVDVVVIGSVPRIEPELAELRRELVRLVRKAWRRSLERGRRAEDPRAPGEPAGGSGA